MTPVPDRALPGRWAARTSPRSPPPPPRATRTADLPPRRPTPTACAPRTPSPPGPYSNRRGDDPGAARHRASERARHPERERLEHEPDRPLLGAGDRQHRGHAVPDRALLRALGCSNFAEIATTASTSYSNSGLERLDDLLLPRARPGRRPQHRPLLEHGERDDPGTARHRASERARHAERDRPEHEPDRPLLAGGDRQHRGHALPHRALLRRGLLELGGDRHHRLDEPFGQRLERLDVVLLPRARPGRRLQHRPLLEHGERDDAQRNRHSGRATADARQLQPPRTKTRSQDPGRTGSSALPRRGSVCGRTRSSAPRPTTCTAWRNDQPVVRSRHRGVGAGHDAPGHEQPVPALRRLQGAGSSAQTGYMLRTNQLAGADQVLLDRLDGGDDRRTASRSRKSWPPATRFCSRVKGATLEAWRRSVAPPGRYSAVPSDSTYAAAGRVGVGIRGRSGRLDDFGAR